VSPVTVFVCEPQPLAIEGLRKVLADCEDLQFAGSVSRSTEVLGALERIRPDVALIDGSSGLASVLRLAGTPRRSAATSHVVLWVMDLPEMEAFRALQMGVRGIVKKTLPVTKLLECLREVGAGKIWMDDSEQVAEFLHRKDASRLTPREKDVVRLVCRGMKNKQIAENLRITPGTVKVHLMHIFEKTGLKDRLALAVHGRDLTGAENETVEAGLH
jgi:two-component system nitrate/nitrite response regulator NarL